MRLPQVSLRTLICWSGQVSASVNQFGTDDPATLAPPLRTVRRAVCDPHGYGLSVVWL